MIELEKHIEILLLSNDCVIIPDLGGFMAHHVDARYDKADGSFLPPLRTLGFNPQLTMNDSLLVQSYIEAYDISYPEALRRIEDEVAELRQHLENEGEYELNDLGVLRLNQEGKMEFEPCEAGILTPYLYGLSSFEMPLLKAPVQAVTASMAVQPKPADHAITIKMSWLRNVVAVAAAILAFLMIGTPISNSEDMADVQHSTFIPIPKASTSSTPVMHTEEEEKAETVEPQQEDSPTLTAEAEITADTLAEASSQSPLFCIVLASQVSQRNAENFVTVLAKQGFNDAHILETKFRRVVYGNYASESEAHSRLMELRSQSNHFKEGWVLKVE